jgi:hypothetical protein
MNKEERTLWFNDIVNYIAEVMDCDPKTHQENCIEILEKIYQQGIYDATPFMG